MDQQQNIVVIIPAYNEENSIGKVLEDLPPGLLREVVVVNNNSNDQTEAVAKSKGATVLREPVAGYGNACLKGIAYISTLKPLPEIVVFIDADYSDYPEELTKLVAPIVNGQAQLVIGARSAHLRESGSMTPQQVFGNWLATKMMWYMYTIRYSDLGPFRAITFDALQALNMQDRTYGWTVEMQLKAAKQKLKVLEVPVRYRRRIGFSKISGTVKGTVLAGYKIITTILKYR